MTRVEVHLRMFKLIAVILLTFPAVCVAATLSISDPASQSTVVGNICRLDFGQLNSAATLAAPDTERLLIPVYAYVGPK